MNLPLISADSTQLRRGFENLISNAFNHNPPGIEITLNAQVIDGTISCTVTDNGVGMSQEMSDSEAASTQHSLFQLYFRGQEAKRSQGNHPYTGLGLGLYLCRQIITAYGGEIGVKSCLGEGTTSWFT